MGHTALGANRFPPRKLRRHLSDFVVYSPEMNSLDAFFPERDQFRSSLQHELCFSRDGIREILEPVFPFVEQSQDTPFILYRAVYIEVHGLSPSPRTSETVVNLTQ